jgi:hypothetical protein
MAHRLRIAFSMLTVLLVVLASMPGRAESASVARRAAALVGNVGRASGAIYGATTSTGLSLDALKIIQGPTPGSYLGVFDYFGSNEYYVTRLAFSDDLSSWSPGPVLNWRASMPTIAQAGSGYLVAFEIADARGRSQIEVEYFPDFGELLSAEPSRVVLLHRHLSASNEGTPSFHSIDLRDGIRDSVIQIGFHYNTGADEKSGADVDRNGVGTLVNFSRWSERKNNSLNRALEAKGVHGSIGARTGIDFDGIRIQLVEGQRVQGRWDSWRIYAYEPSVGIVAPVRISTPRGSDLSVGVPRASIVPSTSGSPLLVLTAFVYQEGSPADAQGELLWWVPIQERADLMVFLT